MLSSLPQKPLHTGFRVSGPLRTFQRSSLPIAAAVSTSVGPAGPRVSAITTLQPQRTPSSQQQLTHPQLAPSSRPGPPVEDYTSSWKHQAIVGLAAVLFAAVELRGLAEIDSPLAASQCAFAAFAGYILAGQSPQEYLILHATSSRSWASAVAAKVCVPLFCQLGICCLYMSPPVAFLLDWSGPFIKQC